METTGKRLKYSGITLGVMLFTALVLVYPIQAVAEEIRIEIEPQRGSSSGVDIASGIFDFNCRVFIDFISADPRLVVKIGSVVPDGISQNTIRNGNIIKTIHAEKEIHQCLLEQGDIPVIVDVTIIGEIYEDVRTMSIISKQALVVTCVKETTSLGPAGLVAQAAGEVLGCKSEVPPTTTVPVGNDCLEVIGNEITEELLGHPQEMNTINKGSIVKTVESQKEVFVCFLPQLFPMSDIDSVKKVDLVIFTEIWEDMDQLPDAVVKKEFLAFRCVTALILDNDTEDETSPASVESCQFISIQD